MSLFGTDHVMPDNGYAGAPTGFMDNFDAAFDFQRRVDSFYGLGAEVHDAWMPSLTEYRRVTGKQGPRLLNYDAIQTAVYGIRGQEPPGSSFFGGPNDATKSLMAEYRTLNEEIKALNNPNIKSLEQIVEEVEALRANVQGGFTDVSERQTLTGFLGEMSGFIAGSIGPRDPIYTGALLLGGFGKSIASRIITEAGIGAAAEAVQQFGGVQPTRQLLGEAEGDPWLSVAFAGAGAGIIRGGFEAGGALLRRNVPSPEGIADDIADMDFGFSAADPVMRQMYERMDTPETRAAIHAMDADDLFNAANPYGTSSVAADRFQGELDQFMRTINGETSTAIWRLDADALPVDLDDLSFEMSVVRETHAETYGKLSSAQERLNEIDARITQVEDAILRVNEADGIARIDPDTADLVRSYQEDLNSNNPTVRERAEQQLAVIRESMGEGVVAKATADAAITPRQELKTLRSSRKAVKKELLAARKDVDKIIAANKEKARIKELFEQKQVAKTFDGIFRGDDAPSHASVQTRASVEDAQRALDNIEEVVETASRSPIVTIEGKLDLGDGQLADPEFSFEIDGKVLTAREILQEAEEDDLLVEAMKVCSL